MVPSTERVRREFGGSLSISGIISGLRHTFKGVRSSDAAFVETIDIVQHLRYIAQC